MEIFQNVLNEMLMYLIQSFSLLNLEDVSTFLVKLPAAMDKKGALGAKQHS